MSAAITTPTTSGDERIGRTLAGKYRLEERLRAGSMGAIYRATHVALDKPVCIKVMHPALAKEPLFAERFHREARAASRIDHPSSIVVLDHGADDGLLYIAMELVEGRDLCDLIEEAARGPGGVAATFSARRVGELIGQTLAALAAAHDVGILHRDLKPENIMVAPAREDDVAAERVKVCDFGVARIDDARAESGRRLTMEGRLLGTPEYMSPEQARGEALDERSDVYAVGVILYSLLAGRLPFEDESAIAVAMMQINRLPPPPSGFVPACHRGLERVCLKALAKDPAERFATAREMRAAVRAAIGEPPAPRVGPSLDGPARAPEPPPWIRARVAAREEARRAAREQARWAARARVAARALDDLLGSASALRASPRSVLVGLALGAALLFAAGGVALARDPAPAVTDVSATVIVAPETPVVAPPPREPVAAPSP